jgi:hypothetical protein
MMSYLKTLVLGGPKADKNDKLLPGDLSNILSSDDFERLITTSLDDIITLYELQPTQKPLPSGFNQKKIAM